jgi:hypothetical protein
VLWRVRQPLPPASPEALQKLTPIAATKNWSMPPGWNQ